MSHIKLSANALKVLQKRYLKRDEAGAVIETPEDMFRRVAKNIASAELKYDENTDVVKLAEKFYGMMTKLDFLPNSPTLMNAGRELQQLSACFVLPVEDSIEGIFEAIKNTALIHKSGGGTGFSFSRLRPEGDRVRTTNGVSSGPVSFMKVFDAATEAIKQGGTRRGANMGILRVDHPDIEQFIECKAKEKSLNNFNLSIAITDEFMAALKDDKEYNLYHPVTKEAVKKLRAIDIFNKICHSAWNNGDPGIIFIDRMNKYNPTRKLGEYEATNPCGEQPLLPYESCNLGSINLGNFVKENVKAASSPIKLINFKRLESTVKRAVHFLDNVIEMNRYPLPEIQEMTLENRKIGLGVMGFADLLIKISVPYNSDEGVKIGEEIMKFISKTADQASAVLAVKKGNFPNILNSDLISKSHMRHATRTTIAPTGTLSMIANCSSGIEPVYALAYRRDHVLDGDESLIEVNPLFEETARKKGFYSRKLMKSIAEKGNLEGIEGIPENVKGVFVTAHQVSMAWHIKMQAAFQMYTDNAVSKTINMPNSATEEDAKVAYLMAHKLECKGVTIYRDGSRARQVLNAGEKKKKEPFDKNGFVRPKDRPKELNGKTLEIETGCGKNYLTVNHDRADLFEIFGRLGKAGGCIGAFIDSICRLISLCLRCNIDPQEIYSQIIDIKCPRPRFENGRQIKSCPDSIGIALQLIYQNRERIVNHLPLISDVFSNPVSSVASDALLYEICPDCSERSFEVLGGCGTCVECGFSDCGN